MLAVGKVTRGGEAYYLRHLSLGDGDVEGLSERPGRWIGTGARALGLVGGPVGPGVLSSLLSGLDPVDLTPLRGAQGRIRIVAFDLTYSVPKSVALLHALAPAEVVEAVGRAHDAAVDASLGYLERAASSVRRTVRNERVVRAATGLVGACFLHRTSRSLDPHLHTHGLIANLAADVTGRWSALDARPLYLHLHTAGALYDAQLRDELTRRLGVSWRLRGNGRTDIAGIPDRVLAAFSKRSDEIAAELLATGWSGPRAARIASLRTRPAKDTTVSYPRLVERWRQAAYDLGIADLRWSRIVGLEGPGPSVVQRRAGIDERAVQTVGRAAGRLERPFTRRELLAASAEGALEGLSVADGERAADALLGDPSVTVSKGSRPGMLVVHGAARARLPAGRTEPLYASAELSRLEASLRVELGRRRGSLGPDPFPTGTVVVATPAGDLLEILAEIGRRARAAIDSGRRIEAHAPVAADGADFQALTGIATSVGPRPPVPAPDGVLLIVGAEAVRLSVFEETLALARARRASVVLLVGPSRNPAGAVPSPARHLLLEAAAPVVVGRWSRDELCAITPGEVAPASGAFRRDRGQPGERTRYAENLKGAVALALGELSSLRMAGRRSVLVAPGRPYAAALERLVRKDVRDAVFDLCPIVSASDLALSVGGRGASDLVVLAGTHRRLGAYGEGAISVVRVEIAPLTRLARGPGEIELRLARHHQPSRNLAGIDRTRHDLGRSRR